MLIQNVQHSIARCLIAVTLCTLAIPVSAQSISYERLPDDTVVGDFVVGPGKVELELNPGESQTVEVLLTNRIGDERTFSVSVEDFTGSRNLEQAVVLLGNERGPYSLRDYISFPQEKITLKHAERARIPVTVSVPVDAEPGGLYGSALFEVTTKPAEKNTESGAAGGAAIVSRIGVLFFVRVPGDVVQDGGLTEFGLKGDKTVLTETPITFNVLFENNGSVYLNPYGLITIKNALGETIGEREVEPWFVLPDSLRLRELEWNRPFLLGRYTAQVEINRGYDNIIDEAEVAFWVVPLRIVVPALIIIIILAFLIRLVWGRFEIRRKT